MESLRRNSLPLISYMEFIGENNIVFKESEEVVEVK